MCVPAPYLSVDPPVAVHAVAGKPAVSPPCRTPPETHLRLPRPTHERLSDLGGREPAHPLLQDADAVRHHTRGADLPHGERVQPAGLDAHGHRPPLGLADHDAVTEDPELRSVAVGLPGQPAVAQAALALELHSVRLRLRTDRGGRLTGLRQERRQQGRTQRHDQRVAHGRPDHNGLAARVAAGPFFFCLAGTGLAGATGAFCARPGADAGPGLIPGRDPGLDGGAPGVTGLAGGRLAAGGRLGAGGRGFTMPA